MLSVTLNYCCSMYSWYGLPRTIGMRYNEVYVVFPAQEKYPRTSAELSSMPTLWKHQHQIDTLPWYRPSRICHCRRAVNGERSNSLTNGRCGKQKNASPSRTLIAVIWDYSFVTKTTSAGIPGLIFPPVSPSLSFTAKTVFLRPSTVCTLRGVNSAWSEM